MKKRDARMKASYDAAQYDPDHASHWAFANGLSADATAPAEVRRTIRNRARYEVLENNSYGKGIINTLAEDTIGTGPRLQLHTPNQTVNDAIELEFRFWAKAARLASKLRVMKKAKTIDGEAVAKIVNNPPLPHDVKLDFQVVECDRLASPSMGIIQENYIDGVHLDQYGNPVRYDILRQHPGSTYAALLEFDTYDRNQILHFFTHDRPEQHRGISEVVTALPLFAFMRRFTLATVAAAETAANHAMVLQTNAPATEQTDEDLTWESIQLQRNAATVLPHEYTLGQVSPEHPATTYEMFKRQILNEVSRCLCMPYNIAAADSSGYNYASGRLDHQVYDRALKVEQSRIESEILDRLLGEWLLEASLLGMLPAEMAGLVLDLADFGGEGIACRIPHSWQWDRRPHVDPSKEAAAQKIRLTNGTTSRELEMRELGLDINEVDQQAAAGFGLDVEEYRQALAASILTNGNPGQRDQEPENPTEDEENPTEDETDEQPSEET